MTEPTPASHAADPPDTKLADPPPPRVSFGVPVRNGAPHIEQCLKCLLSQTLEEIEILISDNASTDATEEICHRYAAVDRRIRYVRQPEDIGMVANFRFVADNARAPYFAWRSHDDLSLPDFAEKLAKLLDDHPTCRLAVPRIHWDDHVHGFFRSYKLPDTSGDKAVTRVAKQMIRFTPHWFYGLYWREIAIEHMRYVTEEIGLNTFHHDIIAMSRLLAGGFVVTAPVTVFVGRRLSANTFDYSGVLRSDLVDAIRKYWCAVRIGMDASEFGPIEKAVIRLFAAYNMNRRHVRLKWLKKRNHFKR